MAGLFNEIEVGRLNRFLSRLTSIKGDAPSPQLSPEVQAIITVLGDRLEHAYLLDETLSGHSIDQAATALVESSIRLRNPVGSGRIATIDPIVVSIGTAGLVLVAVAVNDTNLASVITGSRIRDGRVTASGLVLSSANVAGAFPAYARMRLLADTPLKFPPCVLSPGTVVEVFTGAINTSLVAFFGIRERAAEPSEL